MRSILFLAAASFALAIALAAPAPGQESVSTGRPVLLSADQVSYDEELGIVIATGNVEIAQDVRVLMADTVTYNERTNQVVATGNVSLLEPDGNVVFAEYVELTDDMKNGVVRDLAVLMTDNSRFAAAGGRLEGGVRTQLRKAVYSPCELCEDDPERAPLWQLKAEKVVHDKRTHDIEYTDVWLEMAGIPVLYSPYLSHPDPTVKRRTGFLAPTMGSDSQLGFVVRTPYYFTIGPDKDATLEPIFTSKERVALAGEYRQRFSDGEIEASGSITRVRRRGSDGEQLDEDKTRGHLFGSGRFDINETWRWGFDGAYATDDTYLRRYKFSSEDTLTTSPFAEGFRGRNYMSARGYYFQGLREDDDPGDTPIILPLVDYAHIGEPDSYGGRWSVDADLMNLTRTSGTDSRRLSLKLGWMAPYTSSWGDAWTFSASAQSDAYWVEEVKKPNNPNGDTLNGLTGRFFPQVMIEWRHPFVRESSSGAFRQLIEPVAALVVAPNGGNPGKIPNEDSQDFEFDDTNLFSANRFPGLDRVNGGQRFVYGMKGGVYGNSGGSSEFFLGQSYRFRADDTFDEGSGLRDRQSDIVGRVQAAPNRYLDLLYRFRLARTDFGPIRNEVKVGVGGRALRLNLGYVFFAQNKIDSEFPEREELNIGVRSQVTEYWSVRATHRRDLTSDGGTLSTRLGLGYEDECFTFNVDIERNFFRDRDFESSDTVLFRVLFKGLGEARSTVK